MDLIFRKMEINSLMFASAAAPPDCRCYNRIYWFIFINNTPEFLKVCFEDIIVSAADVSSFCRTAVKERDPKPISLLRKWVWMARLHYFGVMCKKKKNKLVYRYECKWKSLEKSFIYKNSRWVKHLLLLKSHVFRPLSNFQNKRTYSTFWDFTKPCCTYRSNSSRFFF